MARPRIQRNDPPKDEEPDLSPDIISWGKSPDETLPVSVPDDGTFPVSKAAPKKRNGGGAYGERIAALEEQMQRIETKLIALLESKGDER